MAVAIEERPSPNFGPRQAGKPIDMLVLHYTGMPSAKGALSWLCDAQSGVSSHYFVFEDGRIVRLVDETQRAWHAGVSWWAGESDINSRSIGIEIANAGHDFGSPAFPPEQIAAVIALCRDILARRSIPAARVLAHSDVAPERKRDPGEAFPWGELAAAGIGRFDPAPLDLPGEGHRVGEYGAGVRRLQQKLAAFGYRSEATGCFDWECELAILALQRHFRPARVDGVADASTLTTLDRLLAAEVDGRKAWA